LGYNWDLGDNSTSSSTSLSHQYASYGAYPATLIVTSANGCADTITQAVNVYALPVAAMNIHYACEGTPAAMIDASTVPQGMIVSWMWTFGDQSSSAEANPVHSCAQPGTYNLTLDVMTDHGCMDQTNGSIRIVPPPSVDFLTENACLGFIVDFTDRSFPSTGPVVQYSWDFGDGTGSIDQNPSHMYTQPGFYQVMFTATSDSGCSATLVRPNALQIYAPPVPSFTSNASQANDIIPQVDFLNLTQNSSFFYWNFGDGDTSTQYSPTHLYGEVGKYDVQLITVDQRGCVDSITIPIEIKPTSNVYIPNAFTPNGDARNDIFRVYTHNVDKVQVQIYDRWGLKIVEWNDVFGGWDGRVSGTPAQADTYVYRVSTTDINNKQEVFVGHVSLVR
jgi:gliding motility-associated-like protein